MNIVQSLSDIGLEPKQAELYAHLLKQPKGSEQTVFSIAQGVGMPRSTTYLILEELENKKLVSSYKKNNVLHYLTADPVRLSRDLEEKKDLLQSILPTLQALSKDAAFRPSVQTFTGARGVKIVFDDAYNNPRKHGIKEYHTISHPKLLEYMPRQFPKYMENKRRLNLSSKILVPNFVSRKGPPEYMSDSHRETRYLTQDFSFEGTLMIYGRKTALISHKDGEVYSMIIDSQAITEMFDAVFKCLWNLIPQEKSSR
ncbi:MAG: transcriptional regulator TrmB [Candidatus Taylorbacteria bacterium]|nr:transcriptional regulator TrmB [Candidatus Taylorbacteria bacterium]